jgi:hypothetical protein
MAIRTAEQDILSRLSAKSFVRAMSYRDFGISILLAIILLALFMSLDYVSRQGIASDLTPVKWTLFFLILPVNHILYKVVHKRSNDFVGRNIHDYIFLISFATLLKIQVLVFGHGITFATGGIGSLIFLVILLVIAIMIFELAVSLFKRLLWLFKWRIL